MSTRKLLTLIALTAIPFASLSAEGHREKLIKEGGAAYQFQGEYAGSLQTGAEPELLGVQVIAWGRGNFDARAFVGGLPGAGGTRKSTQYFFAGSKTASGAVKFGQAHKKAWGRPNKGERGKGGVRGPAHGLEMTIAMDGKSPRMTITQDGATVGRLERVVRKSPTLGAKAPKGALHLFDGSSPENFVYRNKKPAQMTADGLLRQLKGSGGLFTRKAFNSCRVHLEFLLPFEPTRGGQGRANSGCYFQGRYEVQMLDSFGLEGRENECGGIYSSGREPIVNMAFPPLSWQTYDVEFVSAKWKDGKKVSNAMLNVWHNGVQVYKDLEIDHATTARPFPESPEDKPHYLQDHGHELWYRNFWVLEK